MMTLNLKGQRFGKLTALAPIVRPLGRRSWECVCDCGKHITVITASLTCGNTSSCGCTRTEKLISLSRSETDDTTRFSTMYEIDESGCWLWRTKATVRRYGSFWMKGARIQAHHASWVIHNGKIPAGAHVLHKCDVPRCVNPDHLFIGTHADNMADMKSKGRARSGRSKWAIHAVNS